MSYYMYMYLAVLMTCERGSSLIGKINWADLFLLVL